MRIKIHLGILICFMLTAAATSLSAQSEIFARFQLPEKAVQSLDQTVWDNMYRRMVKNLPNDKFAPGRILFKESGSPDIFLWTFEPETNMAQALAYVKSLPNVEYCQPDYIYTLEPYKITLLDKLEGATQTLNTDAVNSGQPNDPWYPRQVHLRFMGMDKLFEAYGPNLKQLIAKGHDPYIHIMDSGGGCEHPDLNRANIILKKDFVDGDDDPCSSPNGMSSHGEFIAAIMGAISNNNHGGAGIMPPNTKLIIWRVFDKNGQALSSTVALAISQIFMESNGFGNEIVNMSFSGPKNDLFQEFFIHQASQPPELFGKNITFIGSSGNDANETLNYPAALTDVLSAGATEFPIAESGEIFRAGYSSYGKVDIAAPVGGLNQDNDKNGTADGIIVEGRTYDENGKNPTPYGAYLLLGTSGAVPIASAAAALAINMGTYGSTLIRDLLTKTAGDIPPVGFDQETGWGMVRADVAIMSTDDSLPVFGSFSQKSYVCTAAPGKAACEVSVSFTVKSDGHNLYLYDNYNGGSLRNIENSESGGSINITAALGEKTWVLLLYYPEDGISGGDSKVFASAFISAKTASPPTGFLFGNKCALASGSNSCNATINYKIENNGWDVYFWDSFSGQSVLVSGSGTIDVTVQLGVATHVRLYYFITSGNWNTKTDILGPGTGLDLKASSATFY